MSSATNKTSDLRHFNSRAKKLSCRKLSVDCVACNARSPKDLCVLLMRMNLKATFGCAPEQRLTAASDWPQRHALVVIGAKTGYHWLRSLKDLLILEIQARNLGDVSMKVIPIVLLFGFVSCFSAVLYAEDSEGFDGGTDGGFIGNFVFEATGGNPDGNAHINVGGPFFFPSLRTGGIGEPINPVFLGDFSTVEMVTFGFDIRVDSVQNFNGMEIGRPFGIMLIDRDLQGPSGASGVFFETPVLAAAVQDDWTTYSVTIDDPTVDELPSGWIGFGDEDPVTFEPMLPSGASFATVLAGVDEFRLTGAVPGFFFNNAFFDVRIDNVSVDTTAACVVGDVNQDGTINLLDVAPFVDFVTNGQFQCEADANQDGEVNLLDVAPFVDLLSN